MAERAVCHDCGSLEGQLHDLGCDMERCPFCGGQLITCDCCYEKLGFQIDRSHPTSGLPKEIYEKGLPEDLSDKWIQILEAKGRIPWVCYPNICCKCGVLWPELFKVPRADWEKYVEPSMRRSVLCRKCYNQIKDWIDKAEVIRKGEEK